MEFNRDALFSKFSILGTLVPPKTNAANQGRVVDPNITKYSVKVLPFNYDQSTYGFREFFKRHGMHLPDSK